MFSFRSTFRVVMVLTNNTTFPVDNLKAFNTSNYLIVFIIMVMILGIVGNLLTILVYWFYYKKNKIRNFVLTLSTVDLLMCSAMPYVIFYLSNSFYVNLFICKLHFIFFVLFLSSYGLLTVIAIDRFKMIIMPLSTQLSYSQSKVVCFVTGICGLIMMIPLLINMSCSQKTEFNFETNLTITTKFCKVHNVVFDNIYSPIVDTYVVVSIVLCFVTYLILIVYLRIRSKGISVNIGEYCCQTGDLCCLKNNYAPKTSPSGNDQQQNNTNMPRKKNFVKGMRTSLVFLMVTIVSLFVLVPNVLLTTTDLDTVALRSKIHDWVDFLRFMHLMNYTVNPIIYIIVDSKFRRRSKLLYYMYSCCKSRS